MQSMVGHLFIAEAFSLTSTFSLTSANNQLEWNLLQLFVGSYILLSAHMHANSGVSDLLCKHTAVCSDCPAAT